MAVTTLCLFPTPIKSQLNMPLDLVAVMCPKKGKESQIREILLDVASHAEKHEPGVTKYVPAEVIDVGGIAKFLIVEQYVTDACLSPCLRHMQSNFLV